MQRNLFAALGVRQRLVLGVGFMIALLLLLAGGAASQLRAMSAQMENVVEIHERRGELAHRLHEAQLGWMERLRSMMVLTDPEDLKAQFAEVQSAQQRYMNAEATLEKAMVEASPGMRAQLDEVTKLRESIGPVYDSSTRTLLSGGGAEGALSLLLPIETAEARWEKVIEAVVESAGASSHDEFEQAKTRQHVATWGLVAVAGVAILAALGMATSLVRGITGPIGEAVEAAEAIAQGRLDKPIRLVGSNEFTRLALAMSTMQGRLRDTVRELARSAESVMNASTEIESGSQNLSERTEDAAAHLAQTSTAVRSLSSTLASDVAGAREASRLAEGARESAHRGRDAVERIAGHMRSIETAARHITEIVAVIDGIAFKTNLLALNAAVEAARAGEHGRGFGVVAAEVRQLAQSAAKAAGQIRELSSETSSLIRDGAISVGEANGAMSSLVDAGQAVAETVNGVSSRSVHQSEVLVQIDEAVLHLDSSTQQNAALAEQLAAASTYLQQRASELQELISVFSIGDSSANESQRADVHDAPVSVSEAGTT